MVDQVCSDIRTFYDRDRKGKEMKPSKHRKVLHVPIRLAKNARIMLTKNISVSDSLTNDVTGRILEFIEDSKKEASHILIKCDNVRAGRQHHNACQHCREHETVCVKPCWAMTVHKAQGSTVGEVVISSKDFLAQT
ncbi:unnamed protein product [Didymodactylos carnosus]|uniref:ATP-dependent DNA helicase n=1 Tax=Didymodactylos carnosus TaxID=1234261 RepID=A0A815QQR3_9BILA|nr:unnamed protein product [Didymodactylos carnosus]CAF4334526.1 unnamed protein product [Didymodactylos carnosus]